MLPFASRQMANVIRCNGLQRLQLKLVDSTNYTSRDQQCLYSQSLFTKMFDFPLKFNRKVKDDNSNQDKSVISDDVTQVPQKETESNESKVVYQQNQTVEEQLNTTKNDDEHCAIKNSQSSENQITSIINTIKKAPNIESSTLAHSLNSNCTEYDDLKSSANDGINSNEHSLRQQLSLIASIFTNDSESLMQLMLNYPCLLAIQRQATEDLIQLLQSIGLTRQHVADNPWIFCLKLSSFEEKIWVVIL